MNFYKRVNPKPIWGWTVIKRLSIILLMIVGTFPLFAAEQGIPITGTVTDNTGEAIPGVTVMIKGTSTGQLTNTNGNFNINVSNENTVLVFSFMGFVTQEITVGSRRNITVTLLEDLKALDEVVVVGYGTQKKATLTGAVSAITGEEIVATKNENVMNMMTGKVPGVRVVQRTSEPGAFDNAFDIRGFGSPLIVVDGVPRDDFQRMDANEIESISVLKDASAAIYGVRAANGVVLVTTKRGSSDGGKVDISYSFNQGWQQFLDVQTGTDAIQHMTLINERDNRNFGRHFVVKQDPQYLDSDFEGYLNGTIKSAEWESVLKKFETQSQHNLNVNGSSGKISYFFNVGYMQQGGIYKSGDLSYDRWNLRSNVTAQITDNLKAEILMGGMMDNRDQPRSDPPNFFKGMYTQVPTQPLYANNNPDYLGVAADNSNPIALTYADVGGYRNTINNLFQSSVSLSYDIPFVKGLKARGMYSYDKRYSDAKNYSKAYTLYTYDSVNEVYKGELKESPSTVQRSYDTTIKTLMQLELSYKKVFLDMHNVSAVVLFEEGYNTRDNFSARRELAIELPHLFAGISNNQQGTMNSGNYYENVSKSVIGKFNYDYNSKYIVEFSFRYDGSSRFPESKRWGFFPAASAGWRVSEESFIKNAPALSFVDNLKLRASYGKLGDDGEFSFQHISGYNYPNNGTVFGGDFINGLSSRGIINPNITWSTSTIFNVGIDADLWRGLFGFQFEYFERNREDLLATRAESLPSSVGASLPRENLNSDKNFGFELVLTHRNRINDFSYSVTANLSSTRAMRKHVERALAGNSYDNWRNNTNDRYDDIQWGRRYIDRFTTYQQIYDYQINTGSGNQGVLPGDYYYEDINGDGVVDNTWDQVPISRSGTPLVYYGVTIGAAWKNFDLNILLQGAARVFVTYDSQMSGPLIWDRNSLDIFMDRWHPANPKADVFDPTTVWIPGYYASTGHNQTGSLANKNSSYMRVKSVELGYTLPKPWVSKAGIRNLRVFVSAYNLFTFTSLPFNIDPERPGSGDIRYPINRTFNIGAKVSL